MSSRVYIITEGVHDVAFLGKLLTMSSLQMEQVKKIDELESGWIRILPSWPYKGSLQPSVPAPIFYQSASKDISIAVVNAEGINNMSQKLARHLKVLDQDGIRPDAVGAVLDADSGELPQRRFDRMAEVLANADLPRPAEMEVVAGTPRTGVFILPGGGERGTLEDLLLECAATVYPTLGCRAVRFIDGLERSADEFMSGELGELAKPAGRHKSVVAAMGAVLKPGKPIRATLEDHRWIEPRTLALPRIQAVLQFLTGLVGAPVETSPIT